MIKYLLVEMDIGLEQLKEFRKFKKKRSMLVNYYIQKFYKMKNHVQLVNYHSKTIFWHLFVILLKGKLKKNKLRFMNYLKKKNIGTQIHYKPISLHKSFKKFTILNESRNSMSFYKGQLTLPLHVNMNRKNIDYIINIFEKFIENN